MERLSIGDLMTIWSEVPSAPMNVGLAAELAGERLLDERGRLRLDLARTAIEARLVPALRRRIRWTRPGQGRPLWIDDPAFRIERHVMADHLPAGQAFASWAATLAARPLDRRYPLWRITLVTGLPERNVGLVLVAHHAMADGIEAGRIAVALLDPAPATPVPYERGVEPTGWELTRDAVARRAAAAWRLIGARAGRHRVSRELGDGFRAIRTRAPALGLPFPDGPRRRLEVGAWPLADIRDIAHSHGVTINDLVLAAVAAGLRALLPDADGLTVRVSIPMAAPPGQHNTANTPPIVIGLPLVEPDRTALGRVNEQTRAAKANRERRRPGLTSSELVPRSLVRLAMRWLRGQAAKRINLYVTNVPGPTQPLALAGAELRAAYPIPPLIAGVPLAVGALSYRGTLSVAVSGDPRLDLARFTDGMRAAVGRYSLART
jgi:WS/DGAT/MGAT family acyltransferase